jgi:hypothetical protein
VLKRVAGHAPEERRLALVTAGCAGAIALTALVGRLSGVRGLYAPIPDGGGVPVDGALVLGLLAFAVVVRSRALRVSSLVVSGGFACLSLVGYLGGPRIYLGSRPMALATAVCALLLVLAGAVRGWPRVRQLSAVLAGAIGGLVLIGFAYGTRTLVRFSDSSMAVPAAVAIVLIAVAVLANTPGGWLPWVLRGTDAGAVALRRTLPVVVFGIPALTYLHLAGEKRFWNDERVAEAGFVTLLVIMVSLQLFWVASSLQRLDQQREQARRNLVALNARLMSDVQTSYATLRSARQRIGNLENSQRAVLTVHDDVLQTIYASGLMLRARIETGRGEGAVDPSVERTLECLDAAVQAIRIVVEDLNDNLDTT